MNRANIPDDAGVHIERFCEMAGRMDRSTDIFIMPELWTGMCGAEDSSSALDAVRAVCADIGMYAIAGTMPWPVCASGGLANRAWVVNDAGAAFAFYDKAHLFSSGGNDYLFTPGNRPLIFDLKGISCSVVVGYEMRFPEYTRCVGLAGGMVIFAPSLWPATWVDSWEMILRSAAASSQTYVVACNTAEPQATSEKTCFGRSIVISPWGSVVASLGEEEGIMSFKIDVGEIFQCRKYLPLQNNRRPDLYRLLID
jgi:predicted amidohydrolase